MKEVSIIGAILARLFNFLIRIDGGMYGKDRSSF
jgi:hypothetical protein